MHDMILELSEDVITILNRMGRYPQESYDAVIRKLLAEALNSEFHKIEEKHILAFLNPLKWAICESCHETVPIDGLSEFTDECGNEAELCDKCHSEWSNELSIEPDFA